MNFITHPPEAKRTKRKIKVPDLDHVSEALQFEVDSQRQTVVKLENPCL